MTLSAGFMVFIILSKLWISKQNINVLVHKLPFSLLRFLAAVFCHDLRTQQIWLGHL